MDIFSCAPPFLYSCCCHSLKAAACLLKLLHTNRPHSQRGVMLHVCMQDVMEAAMSQL